MVRCDTIKDPLLRFEKSFPFYRIHVCAFIAKINEFGKETIEYSHLKTRFDSEAWEG